MSNNIVITDDSQNTISCNCGSITKKLIKEKIHFTIEKAYEDDNKDRIFESYATYEEIDKQGDLVKAEGLTNSMPIWLDRGGVILDSHTNKHIGKGLEHSQITVDGVQAVWLKSKIFSGRLGQNIDDEAWAKIQSGVYKGLSIGGQTFTKFRECKDNQCYNVIPSVQLYEISVVENPANGGAIIIVKEDKEDMKVSAESKTEKEVKKENVEVGGKTTLDINVHVNNPAPSQEDVTKQEDTCGCGDHNELLKEDDFCKCEDVIPHLDKGQPENGSQYVDLFLSLNQTVKELAKEIHELKVEKAKKEDDDEDEEDEEKKKSYGKKKKAYPKEDEDEEKADDEKPEDDEEDEKKTTEDGLTSEPKGTKKKKGVSKSVTPRPGIVNENPETTIGNKNPDVAKSPMLMEDIISVTMSNNVNKALEKIDDVVYKHQQDNEEN